ncbi:MAG: hypothetical protein ACI4DS_06510 [Eubacterium sp.]
MNFLYKLEQKFGKYAIRNLSLYLIIGYIIGYVLCYAFPDFYRMLTLDPYYICRGQIWRVVTWVITPPSDLGIFTIIMLIFYYSIGTSLEQTWGAFRYNLYIFSGMFFTIIGAGILYSIYILGGMDPSGIYAASIPASAWPAYWGNYISVMFSTYYINLSIFLAFAACYPDMKVMLYFIIPIKIKWLAILDVVLLAFDFFMYGWGIKVAIITSLFNFILFMIAGRNYMHMSPGQIRRRYQYNKEVSKSTSKNHYTGGIMHKCEICGRTDQDDENLVFRYCSKCDGVHEYCQEHLFTHEHIKNQ